MGWVSAKEYPQLVEEHGYEWNGMVWFPEGAKVPIARIRRGRWVPIPPEWRGKVTHGSSIRKRNSKFQGKKKMKQGGYIVKANESLTRQERKAPRVDEEW